MKIAAKIVIRSGCNADFGAWECLKSKAINIIQLYDTDRKYKKYRKDMKWLKYRSLREAVNMLHQRNL